MDFASIGTIGGLISATIGATKNAHDLAKDTTNHELKKQINEVYDGLFELRNRILALDDENRRLKAALEEKSAYVGPIPPHGYVYEGSDTERKHPLCPTCYQQRPQQISFMSDLEDWNGGQRRTCKLNHSHLIYEREMDLSPSPRIRSYNPY